MRKSIFITFATSLFLTMATNAYANEKRIATISPLAHSLTQALTDKTAVNVVYLPPKRLPVNRLANWIHKNKTKNLGTFDVLITTRSINAQLDMFATLRQQNIRLVEVDIAKAILPNGEQVVLANNSEYYWLNNNNLLLMLGILKRDLSALWPSYSTQFAKNFQSLSSAIRKANLEIDNQLNQHDIAFLVFNNQKLSPIASSLASDSINLDEAKSLGLPFLMVSNKKKQALATNTWFIDDFSRFSAQSLKSRLHQNSIALSDALTQL